MNQLLLMVFAVAMVAIAPFLPFMIRDLLEWAQERKSEQKVKVSYATDLPISLRRKC